MSHETAKSTGAERFGGLVGLDAFAGSVADMFLGYVDIVLRGLTMPFCDTRVGAPSSMISFFGKVVVDSSPPSTQPRHTQQAGILLVLVSTSNARTRTSYQ